MIFQIWANIEKELLVTFISFGPIILQFLKEFGPGITNSLLVVIE